VTSQLERTGRRVVAGTWACAVITMAASAANAALTYAALGDNRALGLATGLAVDIGLCVALIGDRQLYEHGLSSNWGRGLRITTAVMSLILNVGISLRDGHYFAALLHSFLPVLLIVMTEYGQDVLLQFTALRRERETTPQVPAAEPEPAIELPAATYTRVGPSSWTPPAAPVWRSAVSEPAVTPKPAGDPEPVPAPVVAEVAEPEPTPESEPEPPRVTSPDAAQATEDELAARVRKLLTDSSGRVPGRRTVAKQLGVTEHQARLALELVGVTTGSAFNGAASSSRPRGNSRGAR